MLIINGIQQPPWWWWFTGPSALVLGTLLGLLLRPVFDSARARLARHRKCREFAMIHTRLSGFAQQFEAVPNPRGSFMQCYPLVRQWAAFDERTKESLVLLEPEWGRRWHEAVIYGSPEVEVPVGTYIAQVQVKRNLLKDIYQESNIRFLDKMTILWHARKRALLRGLRLYPPTGASWNNERQQWETPDGKEWRSIWRPNKKVDIFGKERKVTVERVDDGRCAP